LQIKIKVLNNNNNSQLNHKSDVININNNSSSIKTKANSTTIYSNSKDDLDYNNKYRSEELYIFSYKNKTMSNIKPSRNNNFFTLLNKQSNKNNKNNISMQNNFHKNFSSNSLRKNNSNNNRKKNIINTNRKRKNLKQNIHNCNSLNITNNTYNMSKNNIMINLNPRNSNMNLEKLKVQKKLYEYQKLIDKKLNELIKNRHPNVRRNNKYQIHIRRNSSPNIYLNNNSQRKPNNSLMGLEYFLRKIKQKSATPNTNYKNNQENNSFITRKIITKKNNQRNNNKTQSIKTMKKNADNISNLKQNINKASYYTKTKDLNNTSKQDFTNDSITINKKNNLSLRKYIFAKCNNKAATNEIKN
jgi:hypothetical protein